jgi:very-short-patch-repair endonuclease
MRMVDGALDHPRGLVTRARRLRKTMSLPEVLLWKQIRPNVFDGPHIRRQHPFGPYTLDFYRDAAKLCIEVDGEGHGFGDQPERDEQRDAWLLGQGIRTLRLPAKLVLFNMDSALSTIRQALSERPHPPGFAKATPGPLPQRGRIEKSSPTPLPDPLLLRSGKRAKRPRCGSNAARP